MRGANSLRMRAASLLCSLAVAWLAACSADTIVYRDRPPFNPPPDSINGFLGLFDVSTNQTTCGNCHVGHQRDWKSSAHSGAFATLVNSGHATASCYGCHTVSEHGNLAAAPAGWNRVPDSAYRNVQCENCHGPGLNHVQEPDLPGNVPLAHVTLDQPAASCASCHSGVHQPFAEEWAQSGHAQVVAEPAGRAECASCHDGRQTLIAWNADARYAERNASTPLPTTCAVCHDPHGSPNEAQLRFSISSPDPEQNLCMRCHIRRSEPAGGSAYANRPHAPQGAVLLGTAGYRPAGFAYDTSRIYTSHASERNPRLCAGCHVNQYDVTDEATGAFVLHSTGHLFRPIPCLDGQSRPTADNGCAYTTAARSFAACANSGCHASGDVAASALINLRDKLKTLADVLWQDVNHNETVDPGVDLGYLPMVKQSQPGEFAPDTVITAAEGAEFNARLVGEGLYANGDKSLGVHNPFLAEALLRANIREMQQTYSLPPVSPAAKRILDSPLPGAGPQARSIHILSAR
jgi:predicted CXXCH cytochrome family protein